MAKSHGFGFVIFTFRLSHIFSILFLFFALIQMLWKPLKISREYDILFSVLTLIPSFIELGLYNINHMALHIGIY